jgi:hypothetical protein
MPDSYLRPIGEMAVVEAAQKARSFEESGQREEAEAWRGDFPESP